MMSRMESGGLERSCPAISMGPSSGGPVSLPFSEPASAIYHRLPIRNLKLRSISGKQPLPMEPKPIMTIGPVMVP